MSPRRFGRAGARAFVSIAAVGLGVQLLTILSGPLVARMIGPNGRGQMVLVTLAASLCAIVGTGGLPAAIARTVAASGAPARDVLRGLLSVWVRVLLLSSLAAAVLAGILVRHSHDRIALSISAFFVSFGLAIQLMFWAMLQGEGNVRRVNLQKIIGIASYVLTVVVIFIAFPTDEPVVLLAVYALSLLGGFIVCWKMLRRPTGDASVRASREEVHGFARRSLLSGLSTIDAFGIDQLLVGLVLGPTSLGLYAVASSATSVPSIVMLGLGTILLPRMVALPPAGAQRLMRRWIAASVGLAVLIVVGVEIVIGPALRLAFGHEFVPATGVARVLAAAWAILGLRRVLTSAAQAQGKVSTASYAELGSTVVLVVSAVIGMHVWGLKGAAFGMLLAGVVFCVAVASSLTWRMSDEPSEPVEVDLIDVFEHDVDPLHP